MTRSKPRAISPLSHRRVRATGHSRRPPSRACGAGAHPKPRDSKGGCYVYLLLHASQHRFKIGLSHDPARRAWSLPEAQDIARERSIQVLLPSHQRASQVERMLHKALAGFRMKLLAPDGAAWDGSTEWFSLPGLPHAINLLKAMPVDGDPGELAQLQTLDGQPYKNALAVELVTPAQQRRQLAGEHNLRQITAIVGVLTSLRPYVPMQLGRASDLPGKPWCLRLQGLKTLWEPSMLKARFEVVASGLWTLQTGRADRSRAQGQTVPLVRLIRYSQTEPGTLELVLTDWKLIRPLPAGVRLLGAWGALLVRMVGPDRDWAEALPKRPWLWREQEEILHREEP